MADVSHELAALRYVVVSVGGKEAFLSFFIVSTDTKTRHSCAIKNFTSFFFKDVKRDCSDEM